LHFHAEKNGFSFLLQSIVKGALDVFLGHTEAGQLEEAKYFIYMHNNAVVRLDVMVSKSTIALLDLSWCLSVQCSFTGGTLKEKCGHLHSIALLAH
jgi:hypothetical protein